MNTWAIRAGITVLGAFMALVPLRVQSQDRSSSTTVTPVENDDNQWSFRVAPYLWATALNGDIGVDGLKSHINASVGEVIDHVEGGAMLTAEARYGRWGIVTDFIYADLADRKFFDAGLIESVKLHVNQYIWTQAGAYRAYQDSNTWLDLLAGFRLVSMDQTLSVTARDPFASSGQVSDSVGLDRTWIDPIIGIRSAIEIFDRWAIRSEGDIGGFNANSKFTWQAFAALGYDATDSTRVLVGYRGLGYDHDRDGFTYDTVMHGPIVGVGVGF
jgi:opacity protein-like surface antigen